MKDTVIELKSGVINEETDCLYANNKDTDYLAHSWLGLTFKKITKKLILFIATSCFHTDPKFKDYIANFCTMQYLTFLETRKADFPMMWLR